MWVGVGVWRRLRDQAVQKAVPFALSLRRVHLATSPCPKAMMCLSTSKIHPGCWEQVMGTGRAEEEVSLATGPRLWWAQLFLSGTAQGM